MSTDSNKFTITIMGKEYQIACPPEQQLSLAQAAQHLDAQMRKIRENGKVIGLERIAIMAALNLSHELLDIKAKSATTPGNAGAQLSRVNEKLDNALARFQQLEL